MNDKQRREEYERLHQQRMADADSIELVKKVDALGNVDWHVIALVFRGDWAQGQGYTQNIGGFSCASYEAASREAHKYATLPGSHTMSEEISGRIS